MTKDEINNWLSDDEYNKFKFILRSGIGARMNAFRCYGLQNDVDQAIEDIMEMAENFGQVVRGRKNKRIHKYEKPEKRATEK